MASYPRRKLRSAVQSTGERDEEEAGMPNAKRTDWLTQEQITDFFELLERVGKQGEPGQSNLANQQLDLVLPAAGKEVLYTIHLSNGTAPLAKKA
jgi:hypothetical protein